MMNDSIIHPPATCKAKLKQKFKDSTPLDPKAQIFNKKAKKTSHAHKREILCNCHNNNHLPGAAAPLGNYAKFSAKSPNYATDESISYQKLLWDLKTQSGLILSHLKEFKMKKIVLKLRDRKGKAKHLEVGKIERICRVLECGISPVPIKDKTHIDYVQGEKGKRYFAGLQHCGSGWVCPVCGHKLQTEKTKQLNEALLKYTKMGYVVYFGAITLPHYQSEALSDNLKTLLDGFNWVKSNGSVKRKITKTVTFQAVNKETGEVREITKPDFWYIRSLEITYGQNGWHPHMHPIFIMRPEDAPGYLSAFKSKYLDYLRANNKGNEYIEERAFKVEEWDGSFEKLSEYVNKIKITEGITDERAELIYNIKKEKSRRKLADEVTRGQNKQSREGVTPWDMVKTVMDKTHWKFKESPRKLFQEYAVATKGKAMLQACQYFYNYIGLEELDEAEILQDDKTDKVLFSIEKPLWKKISYMNLIHKVREVYELAELHGRNSILSIEKLLIEKGVKFERNITVFNDA